jgi:hypothetical protein
MSEGASRASMGLEEVPRSALLRGALPWQGAFLAMCADLDPTTVGGAAVPLALRPSAQAFLAAPRQEAFAAFAAAHEAVSSGSFCVEGLKHGTDCWLLAPVIWGLPAVSGRRGYVGQPQRCRFRSSGFMHSPPLVGSAHRRCASFAPAIWSGTHAVGRYGPRTPRNGRAPPCGLLVGPLPSTRTVQPCGRLCPEACSPAGRLGRRGGYQATRTGGAGSAGSDIAGRRNGPCHALLPGAAPGGR